MNIKKEVEASLNKIWETAHHLESDVLKFLVELEQHKADLGEHDFVSLIEASIEPATQQIKIKAVEAQALANYCEALADNF